MSDILFLDNIVKRYSNHTAVDHVTFNVPKGSIFGLLGPNGAGKTSLIRIITTITKADEGTVYLDGEKLSGLHPSQIGYMPEERGLYKKMKVGDHLIYLARLKGLSKAKAVEEINKWMEKFEITAWWDKKIEELSKGMQQKIQFIATVVHQPKLLILDEPFSGLDPVNTNLIKDEIDRLHHDGTSIIFSTHRMEQVEEICENIVLINKGKNVLQGKVRDIKRSFKRNLFQVDFEGELPRDLEGYFQIISLKKDRFTFQAINEQASNEVLKYLIQHNIHIVAFHEILPTLNEIFIEQVRVKDVAVV